MHFERLVIEAGKRTYALDLHRRLTVIAGVGHLEREGLITELIGGLSAGRSGVHLEIASDAGQRYAIFRPAGGRHRVVDIDHSADVTESFTTDQGLDVLRRAGIDPRSARRQLCVTPDDLATRSQLEHYVASLARLDQSRLWDVAEKVKDRERRLTETAQETGSDTEDAVAYAEIERRHQDFERAQEENERVRYLSFITGAGSALVGVAAAALYGFFWALPFLMLAVGATIASVLYWQRLEMARKAEEEALRAVGVTSYLTFQIHRVNGLIGNDHARRVMMQAAEEHRAAMAEWRVLVGDVPIEWAVEHRREIREQAAQAARCRGANRLTDEPAAAFGGQPGRARPRPARAPAAPQDDRRGRRELPDAARRRARRRRAVGQGDVARAAHEGFGQPAGDLPDRGSGRGVVGPGRDVDRAAGDRGAGVGPGGRAGEHAPPPPFRQPRCLSTPVGRSLPPCGFAIRVSRCERLRSAPPRDEPVRSIN